MTDAVQIVTPHLVVRDANAALEFYKKALGATETVRMPAEDGKRLMHSEIQVNGARIFVMDDFPEHRGSHGVDAVFPPDQIKGTSVTMHLEVENCDAAVKRARDAGAPSRWSRGIRSGARAMPASWTRSAIPGALRTRCPRRAEAGKGANLTNSFR